MLTPVAFPPGLFKLRTRPDLLGSLPATKTIGIVYTGNVMTENRNGFVVEAELRQVSGMVERETAKDMIVRYSPGAKRITVGADKGFDTADFVSDTLPV